MAKRFLFLGLVLLLPAGCSMPGSSGAGVPDSVMVDVLTELHLLQARMKLGLARPVNRRDSVLAAHGLSERRFQRALRYYVDRPQEYMVLYDSVVERLQKTPQ